MINKVNLQTNSLDVNKDRIIAEFMELVAIDSPSFGERKIADRLRNKLEEIGFHVVEDEAGKPYGSDCGNLYGYLEGSIAGEPLLFSAHMDTVIPALGKKAVLQDDGRITSEGDTVLGADDVAGIVAILEAIRSIREEGLPHRSIEILFPIAEELYAKGSSVFDYSRIRSKEAYVLDLSGSVGRAAYAAPSILSFQAEIKGKAAHAGFCPEEGVHAIVAVSKAIAKIKLGRVDEATTVNIGTIAGGEATNIIPEVCRVEGEVRSFSHEHAVHKLDEIKAIFKSEAEALGASLMWKERINCMAYETDIHGTIGKRYQEACEKAGAPCEFVKTLGGSDCNVFSEHGMVGLVLANAMNQVHSCDEYTEVEELLLSTAIVQYLMTSVI